MNWYRVDVRTTHEGIEVVSARLGDLGVTQLEIIGDVEDIRAQLEKTKDEWDYVDENELLADMGGPRVAAYLPESEESRAKADDIRDNMADLALMDIGFPLGSLEVGIAVVDDADWANSWKKFFKPFPIGGRFLVEPDWDRAEDARGRERITLAFGMVFGTGQHASTQLCLKQLEELDMAGKRVLDFGCGTGILSLGALKLGALRAVCVDIDPLAAGVCEENARLNGLEGKLLVHTGNAVLDAALQAKIGAETYDVVLANIVADVIMPLAPFAARVMAPGGVFICSGIVRDREDEVAAALERAGMRETGRKHDGEWTSIAAAIK